MEFWSVEAKCGQQVKVKVNETKLLHLSQACIGECNNKGSESVCLKIHIDNKSLVLGTLNTEKLPQQLFDLVFDQDFEISHNWKNGIVYFHGYIADRPDQEQSQADSESESDEEAEAIQLPVAKKEEKTVAANKKDGKVKIVEPVKDDDKKADEDDSDSDEDDSEDEDSDEDKEDSSDSEDGSDEEEEETPEKKQSGKKRPSESAIITPANEKKAKFSTPQKTDGKKAANVHVATPHPSKKSKQESPASTSGGAFSCKSCNRNFKSDMALQSHNQAKHK